jgi:hypothetical protein
MWGGRCKVDQVNGRTRCLASLCLEAMKGTKSRSSRLPGLCKWKCRVGTEIGFDACGFPRDLRQCKFSVFKMSPSWALNSLTSSLLHFKTSCCIDCEPPFSDPLHTPLPPPLHTQKVALESSHQHLGTHFCTVWMLWDLGDKHLFWEHLLPVLAFSSFFRHHTREPQSPGLGLVAGKWEEHLVTHLPQRGGCALALVKGPVKTAMFPWREAAEVRAWDIDLSLFSVHKERYHGICRR